MHHKVNGSLLIVELKDHLLKSKSNQILIFISVVSKHGLSQEKVMMYNQKDINLLKVAKSLHLNNLKLGKKK